MNRVARFLAAALMGGATTLAAADNLSLQQADGKLLAVIDDGTAGPYQQQLERRNTDGSLDPRFGRGGRVAFNLGAESLGPRALRVDPQGRLLVIGAAFGAADRSAPATVRFLPDGRLDASWGAQGHSLAPSPDGDALGLDALGMADASVLLLGEVESRAGKQIALWRLRGDGSADPGFGQAGVWVLSGVDGAQALALQPGDDGAALIALQVPAQGTNWLEVRRWRPGSSELELIARQPAPREWRGPVTLDRVDGTLQWFDASGGSGLALAMAPDAAGTDGAATEGTRSAAAPLGNAGLNPFSVDDSRSTGAFGVQVGTLTKWLAWAGGLLAAVLGIAWWQLGRRATTGPRAGADGVDAPNAAVPLRQRR